MLTVEEKAKLEAAIESEVIAIDGKSPLSQASDKVTKAMLDTIEATKRLAAVEKEANDLVDKTLGVTAQKVWIDNYIREAKTLLKVAEKMERIALQEYNNRVKELDTAKFILSNN